MRGAARRAPLLAVMAAEVSGVAALVARTGYTGEDGFELLVEPGDAPSLWNALIAAGARCGLVPAGLSARDTLRLEAGMPLYGHELDLEHSPLPGGARPGDLRFDKPGDFVGPRRARRQRQDAPARPGRSSGSYPPAGVCPARAPRAQHRRLGDRHDNRQPRLSPSLHQPIAMAYLEAPAGAVGTTVEVNVPGAPPIAPRWYRSPSTGDRRPPER